MQVPLLDLQAQYQALREPIMKAVDETLASGAWILGPKVKELEGMIAERVGANAAIGCASGTDALLLSIRALHLQPGDEVICPTFTFFASAGAIVNARAVPVFVDVDEDSFNMSPAALEKAITDKTKAVMPVHLFGQSAEMDPILDICKSRGIAVIEDAAQSIGSTYKGRRIGSLGDTACFSFYPTKNLGGNGDGGMITTSNEELEANLRMLRVHGARTKYYNEEVGFNSRLDAIQAAILMIKLEHLSDWAKARQTNARNYDEALGPIEGIVCPKKTVEGDHVYNQYTIRVQKGERDSLRDHLKEQGIGSEVYYPYPLHLLPAFECFEGKEGDHPVSERAAQEALSIPIFPEMTPDQQGYVIETIKGWVAKQ